MENKHNVYGPLKHKNYAPISIPYLTPDDRPWRIDWFGELLFPGGTNRRTQPCVRVVVSPVICDPLDNDQLLTASATDTHKQTQRWLPISMLPYVRVGDIWQHGAHIISPTYQQESFTGINISRETTDFIKSGLPIGNQYLLPLDQHPWHSRQTQSYCITVTLPNNKRIVITCIELIRFYFGSSSSLLHRLFTSQISFDHLWRNMHFDDILNHLNLKLSDGISGAAAADIGRISCNIEAWNAARMIFNTCQKALLSDQPAYTYTGFPFTGKTDLLVSGKWLSYGAETNSTFVVYRIYSCSYPFPFSSLRYEVADSDKVKARKKQTGNQAQPDETPKTGGNGTNGGKQTLSDENPGNSRAGKEHWIKEPPRFPDLIKKPVWRERYDTVDAPGIFLKLTPDDEYVSVGESIGNSKIRAVDIVSEICTGISADDASVPKFVRAGIKAAIKNARLAVSRVSSRLITIPGYSHPVISLPNLIDEEGEINPVSLHKDIYGQYRNRRGCFVEIKNGDTIHCRIFIVEAESVAAKMRVIDVPEFDLKRGMEMLVNVSQLDV